MSMMFERFKKVLLFLLLLLLGSITPHGSPAAKAKTDDPKLNARKTGNPGKGREGKGERGVVGTRRKRVVAVGETGGGGMGRTRKIAGVKVREQELWVKERKEEPCR
jgi:hypothetical protein